MAITLVQSKWMDEATSQPSLSISFDTLPTPGNLVVVMAASGHASAASDNCTCNQGPRPHLVNGNKAFTWAQIVGPSAGTYTFTWTQGPVWSGSLAVMEWAGVIPTPLLDTTYVGIGSLGGGNTLTGPIPFAASGGVIIGSAYAGAGSGNISTCLNGYTEIIETPGGSGRSFIVATKTSGLAWDGLPPAWSLVSGGVTGAGVTTLTLYPAAASDAGTDLDGALSRWRDGLPAVRTRAS